MPKSYMVLCKGRMIYEFADKYTYQEALDVATSMSNIWPGLQFMVVQHIQTTCTHVQTDDDHYINYKVWDGKGKFPWQR